MQKCTFCLDFCNSKITTDADVKCQLGNATTVFQHMRSVWTMSTINTAIEIKLFNAIVMPTAVYSSETCKSTTRIIQKINIFQQCCLRRILHLSYGDRVTHKEIHVTNEEAIPEDSLR